MNVNSFIKQVENHAKGNYRHMPWRVSESDGSFDPYKILVSEMMLQQTQVKRATPKYEEFIREFDNIATLSQQPLSKVLKVWSGLGYNRRAKFLWQSAQIIQKQYGGTVPSEPEQLEKLPGIGKNTAAAVCVYCFNTPHVFIETNIRTVYLHHFFKNETGVSDKQLMPLIQKTINIDSPRQWFWALMDYGAYIKQEHKNPSRRSYHYTKQSKFEGSRRQLRANVIKSLLSRPMMYKQIQSLYPDVRLQGVLEDLAQEGFIQKQSNKFSLV